MTDNEFMKIKECIKHYRDIIGDDLVTALILDIIEEVDIEDED